jgi:hypothetical protein
VLLPGPFHFRRRQSPDPKARPKPAGFSIFIDRKDTKHMATEAQIKANQENAKKSTGPKSAEGKARSAQNGRTHGLCAKTMLLTCPDDEERFLHRCQEISDQYAFEHALKQTLVTTLASAELQIQFINRMKRGVVTHLTDIAIDQLWGAEPMPTDQTGHWEMLTRLVGIAFLRDASDKNALGKFNRYESEQHRIFHRAMNDLERLYDKWKDAKIEPVEEISEPAESVNEANPIPEPPVENKPLETLDNGFAPEVEPKIAAEKEVIPSLDPVNPDPLLPKAA